MYYEVIALKYINILLLFLNFIYLHIYFIYRQLPVGDSKVEGQLLDYMGKIYPKSIEKYNTILENKEPEDPTPNSKTPNNAKKGGKKTPAPKADKGKKSPTKMTRAVPAGGDNIPIDAELLAEIGDIALNNDLMDIATACLNTIKEAKDTNAHTNLIVDCFTIKYMIHDLDNIKGANKLDERRIQAIKVYIYIIYLFK